MLAQHDVVIVPFPFTDRRAVKRRPALVLSAGRTFNARAAHAVMAMITSAAHAPWPLDVPITDLDAAGLSAASVVRMKLFTLDERLVLGHAGHLAQKDARALVTALRSLFTMSNQSR